MPAPVNRFLVAPAEHALAEVVARAPTVAAAIGAFLALWILARVARLVTVRLLGLVKLDETNRKKLREFGLMTRDAREVERKKPGRAGARKRFQFSKR